MASRTAILLFALLGAVLFLQVAVGDDVFANFNGDAVATFNTDVDHDVHQAEATDLIDVDTAEDQQSEATDLDTADADSDSDADSTEETDQIEDPEATIDESELEPEAADQEDQLQDLDEASTSVSSHPLARILHEQKYSNQCWSKRSCKKFFKKPGCCKTKCKNLLTDNRNCGSCGKCCNTRKGYYCVKGCCKMVKKHHYCSLQKHCKKGERCCSGKCVSVWSDCKNCGKCGNNCGKGKACCQGKCKDLGTDCQNCGKCGVKCRRGMTCCRGRCVNTKRSVHNCGKCGQKCQFGTTCCRSSCVNLSNHKFNCGKCHNKCIGSWKCKYGMCGYGN